MSAPLVNQFTKNLSPCSGCGKGNLSSPTYNQFFEKRTKGESVKYLLQVEVEADNVEQALAKKSEGTVLSVNPRPQPPVVSQQPVQRVPQIKPNG